VVLLTVAARRVLLDVLLGGQGAAEARREAASTALSAAGPANFLGDFAGNKKG
jgi:hypothetical protein